MTPSQKQFFDELRSYIDKPLYFYGSIQRIDYFPGKSDIDVDIFTDNEDETIFRMKNLLGIRAAKRAVYKLDKVDTLVRGYKCKYEDPSKGCMVEFSIYNEKDKDLVLKEHSNKFQLPAFIVFLLAIVKYLYYHLGVLPDSSFSFLKNFIMNTLYGRNPIFVALKLS